MGRKKRFFSEEVKKKAVEEYVSGKRSATEICADLDAAPGIIYKWKVKYDEGLRSERIGELESCGSSPEDARKIQRLESELEEYKKKVGELSLINDLLKKLHPMNNYQSGSELTGLINTTKAVDRKRKRVK